MSIPARQLAPGVAPVAVGALGARIDVPVAYLDAQEGQTPFIVIRIWDYPGGVHVSVGGLRSVGVMLRDAKMAASGYWGDELARFIQWEPLEAQLHKRYERKVVAR